MGSGGESVKGADVATFGRLKAQIDRYLGKMVLIEKRGAKRVAIANGAIRRNDQFVDTAVRGSRMTVRGVVETLENASTSTRAGLRRGAQDMIDKMAMADRWEITAGLHRSSTEGNKHITVWLSSFEQQFHLTTDARGNLFRITYGKKAVDLTQ